MFNRKQFQHKICSIVTKDVKEAYVKLRNENRKTIQADGMKMQRQVICAMHYITEETVAMIGQNLLEDQVEK